MFNFYYKLKLEHLMKRLIYFSYSTVLGIVNKPYSLFYITYYNKFLIYELSVSIFSLHYKLAYVYSCPQKIKVSSGKLLINSKF